MTMHVANDNSTVTDLAHAIAFSKSTDSVNSSAARLRVGNAAS
jgi:hypothetical protein